MTAAILLWTVLLVKTLPGWPAKIAGGFKKIEERGIHAASRSEFIESAARLEKPLVFHVEAA